MYMACITVPCESRADINKIKKLMRVAGVFMTEDWLPVENFSAMESESIF